MLAWLAENVGTIVVALVILAAVAVIVRYMRKERKQGGSSCGGDCASCRMHGGCGHRE